MRHSPVTRLTILSIRIGNRFTRRVGSVSCSNGPFVCAYVGVYVRVPFVWQPVCSCLRAWLRGGVGHTSSCMFIDAKMRLCASLGSLGSRTPEGVRGKGFSHNSWDTLGMRFVVYRVVAMLPVAKILRLERSSCREDLCSSA